MGEPFDLLDTFDSLRAGRLEAGKLRAILHGKDVLGSSSNRRRE